jgi:hypothetical protein
MENSYMTLKEASTEWDISTRRINTLCLQGRIPGAVKYGNTWVIPRNSEKPKDKRIKSGNYIKHNDVEKGI